MWQGLHKEERQEFRTNAKHAKCEEEGLSLQQKRKEFEGSLKRINSGASHRTGLMCMPVMRHRCMHKNSVVLFLVSVLRKVERDQCGTPLV